MRAKTEAPETEPVPPKTVACPDCGLSYKTPQGMAGHRRLAHSASSARALDERDRELTGRQRALESKASELARKEEAARRREAEAARRERAAREVEETPEGERVSAERARGGDADGASAGGVAVRRVGVDISKTP